jgi:hypothetical protein
MQPTGCTTSSETSDHAPVSSPSNRVGGDDEALLAGMYAMVILLLGGSPGWDSTAELVDADDRDEMSPADAAQRLLGFDRAAADEAPGGQKLLDEPVDISEFFSQLLGTGRIDPRDLAETTRGASDDELQLALDDAHAFADDFVENARAAQRRFGDDFAGLGIFTVRRKEKEERFFRAGCVLMLLTVRRALGGEGVEQIKLSLKQTTPQARAYNAIIDAFPAYAAYYRQDQDEMLAAADPDFIAQMRDDVAKFIAAHPDIEAALRTSE